MVRSYSILFPCAPESLGDEDATEHLTKVLISSCCSQLTPHVIPNLGHDLNAYLDQLREDAVEPFHEPPRRVVVALTTTHPIGTLIGTKTRLIANVPHLKNALWIVWANAFVSSFLEAAAKLGKLEGEEPRGRVWTSERDGTFFVLTPETAEYDVLEWRALKHWRQVDPVGGSRRSSIRMPAVILPPSASQTFKKP